MPVGPLNRGQAVLDPEEGPIPRLAQPTGPQSRQDQWFVNIHQAD